MQHRCLVKRMNHQASQEARWASRPVASRNRYGFLCRVGYNDRIQVSNSHYEDIIFLECAFADEIKRKNANTSLSERSLSWDGAVSQT
jgi:hypothetical protein